MAAMVQKRAQQLRQQHAKYESAAAYYARMTASISSHRQHSTTCRAFQAQAHQSAQPYFLLLKFYMDNDVLSS